MSEHGRRQAVVRGSPLQDVVGRPGESREPMAVVCGIFGYKEIHKYVDYADPSRTDDQAYVDAQGAWVSWNLLNQSLAGTLYRLFTPVAPFEEHVGGQGRAHAQLAVRYRGIRRQLVRLLERTRRRSPASS